MREGAEAVVRTEVSWMRVEVLNSYSYKSSDTDWIFAMAEIASAFILGSPDLSCSIRSPA